LAALPVELPVSTVIMLRSIADIARSEGEDLSDPEAALSCVEVFALGGRAGSADASESGYFAVRGMLAKTVTEAARFVAERGVIKEGAPILLKFVTQVAARFGLVVTQKVAAQALPALALVPFDAVKYPQRPAQLRRVGNDCGLWRARAAWMVEPCPAGYRCNGRQRCRRPKRYGLGMAGNPE
jgi:EcsC protein family